jgi:hypothetical protein
MGTLLALLSARTSQLSDILVVDPLIIEIGLPCRAITSSAK